MNRFFFIVLVLSAVGMMPVQAQTSTDLNEGVRVRAGATTGAQVLTWWGRAGRTYFVQQSYDLIHWTYVPVVRDGGADVDGLNFASTDNRQFWRLRYSDASTGGLSGAGADFDDDGLTNQQDLAVGADPFNRDSDGDGYYDGQEVEQNSDPNSAASAPSENLAEDENPAMTEKPVSLYVQIKSVINNWYSGGTYPPSSYIAWLDSSGYNGATTYPGSDPKWSTQLGALSYPEPQTSPTFTYFDSGTYCKSFAELRETESDGKLYGFADIVHLRVGLYSNPTLPGQPWSVIRKYFTYSKTLPSPNPGTTPSVYGSVDMVPLQIFQGQTRTNPNECLLLEPTPTQDRLIKEFVVGLAFAPAYDSLALDSTGADHWLTLPAGGDGVAVQMPRHVSMEDNLSYQAVGGGVEPALSTSPFANWPYIETYRSDIAGTEGKLYPAVRDNTTSNMVASARPMLQFDVKEPKELKVTLRIIGRSTSSGAVSPASAPSKEDLEAYLDSVFVPQVNVHTTVTIMSKVNVAFDVGLKQSYGSKNRGVDDGKMGILYGKFSDAAKVTLSDEEAAILAAAPPDSNSAITIYWVACNGMDSYSWMSAAAEALGNPNQLQPSPALGYAGKAWQANRVDLDTRPRVIWVMGRDEAFYQSFYSSQMYCIAHELGHALGNLSHTIENYAVGPSGAVNPGGTGPWSGYSNHSDNNQRLMTGMAGPKRGRCPQLLNKLERDKISLFLDYEP